VAWLGYPGTFGGSDLDYIIADPFIIPPEEESHYSEKVTRLPNCYQSNDPTRPRADQPVKRSDVGLPEKGFVFGALNNTFKITRPIFDVWLNLLSECPDSVLWLLDHHPKAQTNLIAAATEKGISAERLIFAPRVDHASHMVRLSACDLALDTFPYGGHTTTSDFLWAGVPVIALTGRTFASRVAGSLLNNVGLPELITTSIEAYQALAKSLFKDKRKLTALKNRLIKNRDKAPLFDAVGFAKDFEKLLDDLYTQRIQ
jgi:predicted O-linked N-acetylglucosamine transferase (SPINDLY family)